MDIASIIAAILKFAPTIVEVADTLHLNKLAADIVRKLTATLIADAKKTATPIDDMLASAVSVFLNHIADLLEQGAVQDALAVLGALGKMVGAK
jgi:hypothetical protein